MVRSDIRCGFSTALLVAMAVGLTPLSEAQDEPVVGSLFIKNQTFAFQQVVAYPTKVDDERRVTVIVSDRKVSTAAIKSALQEGDGSDRELSLTQPHVRLVFQESGEIVTCSVWGDGAQFAGGGSNLSGDMKLVDGQVHGSAKMNFKSPLDTVIRFDVRFKVPMGLDGVPTASSTPTTTTPVKPSVTGAFVGNSKAAKLAWVSARAGEPFNDKPSITLVFTEQDHSRDPKPDFKAGFGEYGSALVFSVHEDGSIFGCQVAHSAHEKSGFSSIGSIHATEFEVSGGRIQGHFATKEPQETFGETWSVDLEFVVPFAGANAGKPAANVTAKTPPSDPPSKPKRAAKSAPTTGTPVGSAVNVHDLPFPEDADVEFKSLVQQIVFSSGGNVTTVAKQFSSGLAEQGWKSRGADLVTPNSAILNLTRGDATLTVMVKPAGSGSRTSIFVKGLEWDKK